jgi:hypothetical protein
MIGWSSSLRFLAIYITPRTGNETFTKGLMGLTDIFIDLLVISGMFSTITVCPTLLIS